MNVFEDLIEELRDENLLEETVIDLPGAKGSANERSSAPADGTVEVSDSDAAIAFEARESGENERDFFRKRAMEEVSSLQMVEHVLSGIEREHMKMVPKAYDDLEAKKALHRFLQVQGDTTTSEYADAEFQLMNETEAWSSVLGARDRKISVANLRRFCENSRPPLSSQALLALARFYRNASYTELTRAKFEFVITRLFSREIEGEKRRLLFGRAEMIGHIRTLYASWASVALYSTDEASVKSKAIVAGFEDRVNEAETADTFDQLVQNDFFRKVHEYKEATGELFFTPEIVAATIDCNTRIGNKFVDLVRIEREQATLESIEQKYGYEYDQIMSEAAGKTLQLVELLRNLPEDDEFDAEPAEGALLRPAVVETKAKEKRQIFGDDMFRVNKWLLALTVMIVLASGGLYFWSNQPSNDGGLADSADDISLEGTGLKDYLRNGRATDETFYAITQPAWDQLEEEQKKEVLRTALGVAKQNRKKFVQLLNVRGRNVGFASESNVELIASAP